jgi:hypothetical protein
MSDPSEDFKATFTLPSDELAAIRLGYCTPSCGAKHDLVTKLQARL